MLNICVCNLNDGGELMVEGEKEMSEGVLDIFVGGLLMNDWKEVNDVEEGFVDLDEYFNNYGERGEGDKKEWEMKKKEFKEYVEEKYKENGDKCGRLFMWGVEYDWNMMFIEYG